MAWTFNGLRIWVQDDSGNQEQIIPRLQPLDGPTIYQIYGYSKRIRKIECIVVGESKLNTLRGYAQTGDSYELVSPEGSQGDYLVSKVSYKRTNSIFQTIDTSLDCEAPVYNVSLELFDN